MVVVASPEFLSVSLFPVIHRGNGGIVSVSSGLYWLKRFTVTTLIYIENNTGASPGFTVGFSPIRSTRVGLRYCCFVLRTRDNSTDHPGLTCLHFYSLQSQREYHRQFLCIKALFSSWPLGSLQRSSRVPGGFAKIYFFGSLHRSLVS